MEWVIIFGLGSMSYVIHKFVVYYINSKQTSDIKETTRYVWGLLVAIAVFGIYFYNQHDTSIKDEGIYYVNLFEKIDSQKNYRVPGLIYADEDGYRLMEVYWSNGGKLGFDNSESNLVIGEKISEQDNDNKEWFVELTNEKAENRK